MTKKRKTGLTIGVTAACIAVLCAAGVCNGITKEEKAVLPATTTSTAAIITTTPPTTTVIAATAESTAVTTALQITTTVTCSATETTTTTISEQTTAADTTVQLTTTSAPATTTAPAPAEPYNGQTNGDYIYCIGFGWVFNEGGGGSGETNYDMYCNGNKIGYFG